MGADVYAPRDKADASLLVDEEGRYDHSQTFELSAEVLT